MSLIQWDETLVLDVAVMDDSHRALVDAMNAAFGLARSGSDQAVVGAALQRVESLAAGHFVEEEAYMAEIGFPGLVEHRAVHQAMLEKLGGFLEALGVGSGAVDRGVFDFLGFWLRTHTRGLDRAYADYAKRIEG